MKLGLGTAQFGLDYGISNAAGKVSDAEVASILALARSAGVATIDTAVLYGDAEVRLGQAGVEGFEVITKIAHIPADRVIADVEQSLKRLKLDQIHGLMLHRASDLQGEGGAALIDVLNRLKEKGLVRKVGVSVYAPADIDALPDDFTLDLIQIPYNLLDRRFEISGALARLSQAGVEVHARSTFLQGLLLMAPASRPEWSARWNTIWTQLDGWVEAAGITRLQACLGFALANPLLDRLIVGVENAAQLAEMLGVEPLALPPELKLATEDEALINPANWSKK